MGLLDFFKPHWKHSDPAIRAAAIRSLHDDQQEVLASMAIEDSDAGNRLAAVKRLREAPLLKRVRDKGHDRAVKDAAQRLLVEISAQVAKAPWDMPMAQGLALEALEEIGEDQRTLEDVAKNAKAVEIRRLAVPKLIHAGALQSVAQNEEDDNLALQALAKVSKEGALESLSKGARSKAVRTAAKERLKALTAGKGPSAESINRAKLSLVLAVVEKAALAAAEPPAGFAWDSVQEQVEEAERALRQLTDSGAPVEPARLSRFRDDAAKFHAAFARQTAEKAERAEREHRTAEARAGKEAACLALEDILRGEGLVGAFPGIEGDIDAQEIKRLKEEFHGFGSAGDAEDGLQRRFRALADKAERERERRIRDHELKARRVADEQEHGATLKALCEEAETLAPMAEKDPGMVGARLREVRREWNKAFGASGPFPGKEELRSRLEAAFASANLSLDQVRMRNLERIRELVPALEGLLEHPDMLAAEKRFKEIHAEWKGRSLLPASPEVDSLLGRHQAFLDRFREAQDWLRWSNLRAKQAICDRLEALDAQEEQSDQGDRKARVARLKELQSEWKHLGPVPWDSSEALWERYHQVSDRLYEKCREYFAELDVERESNLKAKEELCVRLEALLASDDLDWRDAMETVKEAQGAWKTIGAVPKAQSEALWSRFRASLGAFFERKDKQQLGNLEQKMELAALAESLKDSTDWRNAGSRIKEAQERWKSIGPVPRDQAEPLWARFHGACEAFFQARKAHLEVLDQERPRNQAKKEELCALVESLDSLATDAERFERIREAQATWKEVGPAPREAEDALWERFRKPIDIYFEGRKDRLEEERKQRSGNALAKEDICTEAESLKDSTEWKATIEKIKALQERWKATGPAPREMDQALWRRFRAACDAFFDRLKENSAKRDKERGDNLRMKEDLCFLAEMLTIRPLSEAESAARAAWQAGKNPNDFARFLANEGEPDWQDRADKVKSLQREWKAIGPVPKDVSESIWERFHAACDAVFEERRNALGLPPEDPQVNLDRKLELIQEAEHLAQEFGNSSGDAQAGEGVASRAHALQREWRRIGSVPRAQSDYVWKRFTAAIDVVLGGASGGIGNPSEAEAGARA